MRKTMALVVVVASCVLAARVASAGHFEHWTEAEQAEHAQRAAVAAPCPPPVVEPCPAAVVPIESETVSREIYWRTGADAYDDSQSNPLRLLAYIIHPVGYTLEGLVTRPFHEVVAQPDLEPIFGHDGHAYYGESPFGVSGARSAADSVYR